MSNRLFIFIALYAEAKPLIRHLQLKRESVSCSFDIYADRDAEIYLCLTGTGGIAAATAVGSCMAYYRAGAEDVLMNIGTCAGEYGAGNIFLGNRIVEQISGYTFYPDIWYRHGFMEAEMITVPRVLERRVPAEEKAKLYDMEAAAIYQAASYYLGPHQMCFLKIISDAGEGRALSADVLADLVERNVDRILGQMDWLRYDSFLKNPAGEPAGISMRAEERDSSAFLRETGKIEQLEDCECLCTELHCSQTMKAAVEQCVRYWTLAGVDYQATLQQMREDGSLPCRDKREGKQRFEELKRQLL